ncbi:TRAP transporter, 4TM/12TM fusion protein [Desulfitobacterium dichloroeliminans LMG P-21439]|uniref:TRAP transporter, 4TM/12TM fusion protein n=1 Tax=Desulfitobacterium dichloroeliminans (strain LMG P-21439 / DCA1) TaxID=871963 RepID=L0F9E9_DESDL|nr:TRAP transporter permease [Desulfitobacterium dichloroeliminans]AGA69291.1 TRAP transporter, 4TM/12TM fusion protein [Desulfitobacterium dichloroeliminans LMG P-21439]
MLLKNKTFINLVKAIAITLSLFQLFTTGFGVLEAPLQRAIHLGLVLMLVFLWYPMFKNSDKEKIYIYNIILAIIAFSTIIFFWVNLDSILNRMRYVDTVTSIDMIFGIITILIVLEATRRVSGWPLVIVATVALGYAVFGAYLPGALAHNGVTMPRLVEQMFLLTDGIYGIPLGVASTIIFAFILFGSFLEKTDLSSLFMDLSCYCTRNAKGGPAKVAIFASALFGTISGSAPANVYTTGVFTIPLMKRVGYKGEFAGAVEAVASTGGQIMPPIMGAAAFVMADILGVSYLTVAKAALIPAILFYVSLYTMIHFEALKRNLGTLPKDQVPAVKTVVSKLYYIIPIVILIAVLMSGRSVMSSAFIATLSIVVVAMFKKETRLNFTKFLGGLELAAKNAVMVSTCCACAGIIVGVIDLTGVGFKFINAVTNLAMGNLFLLMVYLAITCIILGMGVPTTPAYIIVAMLGAPALIKMQVDPIAAHMFVFNFAILSVITPPVALAAYSGAAIAKSDPMTTGWVAVRIGIVAFIIPFMFVYQPALLWQGPIHIVLLSLLTACIGVVGLAGGVMGWFVVKATIIERFMLIVGGLTLIYPGLTTDLIGIVILGLVIVGQFAKRKKNGVVSMM